MCPSQQDGIFDCGEEPERLSLQHLSILFRLPHNKTRASSAKHSQEQQRAAGRRRGSGAVSAQAGAARKQLFGYSLVTFSEETEQQQGGKTL